MGRTIDQAMMWMVKVESQRSLDPTTKIGAVITDTQGVMVTGACNHFPHGIRPDARLNDRKLKNDIVVHAEVNAILQTNRDLKGFTLYCTSLPCCRCAGIIIQAGIRRVITNKPTEAMAARWGESMALTRCLFQEAGIEYTELENQL
jgi:dCMP deaminase